MSKKPAMPGVSQDTDAITRGVIFYEYADDGTAHMCPVGEIFVKPKNARTYQILVLRAASHFGYDIPALSFFDRAELFYDNDTLTSMRISGKCVIGANQNDELEVKEWAIPEKPLFTFNSRDGLQIAPLDQDKSYIIVYNKRIGSIIKWDCSKAYGNEQFTANETSPHHHHILLHCDNLDNIDEQPFLTGISIAEIRQIVGNLNVESLPQALMPDIPINCQGFLMVKIADPDRLLLYIIDKARVEYELAKYYVQCLRSNQKTLKKFAEERGLSLDQAKVAWVHKNLTEQAVFVREGVEEIHAHNMRVLEEVFQTSLGGSIYSVVFANWVPLGSVKDKSRNEIKKEVLKQEIKKAKSWIGVRGRGREKRSIDEREKIKAGREKAIRQAIRRICVAAKRSKRRMAAEDMITPASVASEMKKSVATLYRWLHDCELEFETLKEESLREDNAAESD